MFKGLKKFINKTSHLFGRGKRALSEAEKEWRLLLDDLATNQRALSENFGTLPLRVLEDDLRVGRMQGWDFTKGLRRGRSIQTYEEASGIAIPPSAKSAFSELDRLAKNDFPDTMVDLRNSYGSSTRQGLVERGKIGTGQTIRTAEDLRRVAESDPELLIKVRKAESFGKRFKKLLYLGGTIVLVGTGIYFIYEAAARFAEEHTGCFMYTNGNEKISVCKITGCSCNSTENRSKRCQDSLLPDNMRSANSECDSARKDEYCVHCNWNETDPDSIDYIEKSKLPDNTMIVCQKMDALDALIEIIGGTIDDSWQKGREIIGGISDSISQVVSFLPTIIFIVIGIVIVVFSVKLIKMVFGGRRGRSGEEGDGKTGGGLFSSFD